MRESAKDEKGLDGRNTAMNPARARVCVHQCRSICGEPFSILPTFTQTFLLKAIDAVS